MPSMSGIVPPTREQPANDPASLEDKLFRWALSFNLDYLVGFHNDTQTLLREKWDAAEDPRFRHAIELYDKMNSANGLLLVLSFLEEMLVILWRARFGSKPIPDRPTLERYRRLLEDCGIDLGKIGGWPTLCDAYLVRHCLLHANGRVSHMKKRANVRECIRRHQPALSENLDRIVVSSHFLQPCLVAIRELRDALLTSRVVRSASEAPGAA